MRRLRSMTAWLAAVLGALIAAGALAAAPGVTAAADASGHAGAIEVANGVYMLPGVPGEVGPDNLGRVGNAGFIVGPSGVLVIDTGTSYRHGLALLAAIRRVTDRPMRIALLTHARQEFLFGAAAFQAAGIPIQMQRDAALLMRSRCERCLKTLEQVLGDDAMQDTTVVTPDRLFDGAHEIDSIGRPVQVLYFGHSSGPGDIAVLDVASGVLFAGGLLDRQRIPDVQDSDLDGWQRALQALRALPLKTVVAGHGPASPPTVIDDVQRYLMQLRSRALELLRAGTALSEVADAAALPAFASWDQYETIHRRNASVLFVRFEREQLFEPSGSKH